MRALILSFFLTILWTLPSTAVNLDDLFIVKSGTSQGGCDNVKNIIQSWLHDTDQLIATLDSGLNNYNSDKYIRRNLAAFMDVKSDRHYTPTGTSTSLADYRKVVATVQRVRQFFDGKYNPLTSNKPWLFCNSDWQVETEDVYDTAGNQIQVIENGQLQNANIRKYTQGSSDDFPPELRQQNPDGSWEMYAYWSSDIKDYIMVNERLPGNPPSWCNGAALKRREYRFAVTQARLLTDSITICEDAFTQNSEPYETIANALSGPEVKATGQWLNNASPRSLTLLHEIIHLVMGPDNTPDIATKPIECLRRDPKNKGNGPSEFTLNPDSYAFLAWSYWLTVNGVTETDSQGKQVTHKYEWHSGKSKVIK